MNTAFRAVLSPCIGVCTLDDDGLCEGCLRTTSEIAPWADRLREGELLRRALHPLGAVPGAPGWNHEELIDLLPPGQLAEAAVLAGLVPRAEGTQVLLTRRTDGLRHHGGQVSFPGGRVEPTDADAVAAALRESHEEIALPATQAVPLGFLLPPQTMSYTRVLAFVQHPLGKGALFVVIALFLFHGCHRMVHSLHDLGVHTGPRAQRWFYGFATVATILAAGLLLAVGF